MCNAGLSEENQASEDKDLSLEEEFDGDDDESEDSSEGELERKDRHPQRDKEGTHRVIIVSYPLLLFR